MTTFETGRKAETAAAAFLEYKGCTIIDRNWRTRRCEIDIVACRSEVMYFCEVKYRLHARQGDGLDYITRAKLRQMYFAASVWRAAYRWDGESQLCVIAVYGPRFHIQHAIKLE